MKIENDKQLELVKGHYETNQAHGEGLLKSIKEYEGRERFTFFANGSAWNVMTHPSNKVIADHENKINGSANFSYRMRLVEVTEITRAMAEYCQSKPEGEGWLLRNTKDGDDYLDAGLGKIMPWIASDGLRKDTEFLPGKRWCRKPEEKKEPTQLEWLHQELNAALAFSKDCTSFVEESIDRLNEIMKESE